MLNKKDALYYCEQLHPAFAGYLHDGSITQRDALACIFNLFKSGIVLPSWEDQNMLNNIAGLRLTNKKTRLSFEQAIIDNLFQGKNEISSKEVGNYIKSDKIRNIIQNNLQVISTFPIINNELKFTLGKHGKVNFSLNGNPVNTIEEATAFKKLLNRFLLPLFSGLGILFVIFYFLLKQGNIEGSPDGFLWTAGIMIFTILIIFLSFTFSKKTINYDFNDHVIPIAKNKYQDLYKFIKSQPLPKHRFTNEFLSYSIAFGLDTSWNKDFGLEEEIKVDRTPII